MPLVRIWRFPKLGVPFWGAPRVGIIVYRVYVGVPPFWGTSIWRFSWGALRSCKRRIWLDVCIYISIHKRV